MKESAVPLRRRSSFTRSLLDIMLLALIAFAVAHSAGQTVVVAGSSMRSALESEDRLIVSPLIYDLESPRRGDLVVFAPVGVEPNHEFIKRLVALPGDRLRIDHAKLFLNGREVRETYLTLAWTTNTSYHDGSEFTLGPDQYFLMGDNRDGSLDSRIFGPQPRRTFLGRVVIRIWPIDRIRLY